MVASLINRLISRLAECACYKNLIYNNLLSLMLNSVIMISLLSWLLLSLGPLLSSFTCDVAPLSSDIDRFVSLIGSNISGSSFCSLLSVLVTLIVSHVFPLIIPRA